MAKLVEANDIIHSINGLALPWHRAPYPRCHVTTTDTRFVTPCFLETQFILFYWHSGKYLMSTKAAAWCSLEILMEFTTTFHSAKFWSKTSTSRDASFPPTAKSFPSIECKVGRTDLKICILFVLEAAKHYSLCSSPCEWSKQGGSKFNLKKKSTNTRIWCQRICLSVCL